MDIQSRYDVFETGDRTALVCIDEPELQRAVVEQIGQLDYKIHTGLFTEDITVKIKAQTYDLVIVYESFNDSILEGNAVLAEITRISSRQRRQQYVVLLGPGMVSNDAMQAFQHSVDLTFSVSDLHNFASVLRRGVSRHHEFYNLFLECLRVAGG